MLGEVDTLPLGAALGCPVGVGGLGDFGNTPEPLELPESTELLGTGLAVVGELEPSEADDFLPSEGICSGLSFCCDFNEPFFTTL